METAPKWTETERMVVEPIANGILVTITTEIEEQCYTFKSYRQVLRFIKTLDKTDK